MGAEPGQNAWVALGVASLLVLTALALHLQYRGQPTPIYGTLAESGERTIFISLVLALVPFAYGVALLVRRTRLPVLPLLPLALGLAGLWFTAALVAHRGEAIDPIPTAWVLAGQAVAAAWFLARPATLSRDRLLRAAIVACMCFAAAGFRVYSVHSVSTSFATGVHLEAVFYSVAQVAAGKAVLVDLPAQYGLYAELIGPALHLIGGPSVLAFTALMALLEVAAVLMVLQVMFDLVRTRLLRVLGAGALAAVLGYTFRAPADAYLQYYPLRFFFPALAVYLYWHHLRRPGPWKLAALGATTALAIPFNLDSGVPAFGSCFAALAIACLVESRSRRAACARELATFLVAAGGAALLCIAVLQVTAPDRDWGDLVHYQRLFYITGGYMLPIPKRPDFWMLVAGIYVLGVASYVHAAVTQEGRPARAWGSILQVCILGLGQFSYFQGRSHPIVLLVACWPALLALFILADRTLRAVRGRQLAPAWRFAALPAVALGAFLSTVFVVKAPHIWSTMLSRADDLVQQRDTPVTRNLRFVQERIRDPRSVVIISPHESIYYAETGAAAAVSGAGTAENVVPQDRAAFVQDILERKPRDIFFEPNRSYVHAEYFALLDNPLVQVVDRSPDGLLHLRMR